MIQHAKALSFPTRTAWLEARTQFIGASESASIFGVGYANQTPWSVWESKVNPQIEEEAERLTIGRLIEPALRTMFEAETDLKIIPPKEHEIHIHPEYDFISASLDSQTITEDCCVPVELKNVGMFAANEWKDGDTPLKFQVQTQHQMAVTGAPFAFLLGLIAGQHIELRRIERNDKFIDALYARIAEFWELVKAKTPPPIEPTYQCKKALERLHPDGDGSAVALPTSSLSTAQRIESLKKRAKVIDAEISLRENEIRQQIGDATYAEFPDGSAYSWKPVHRESHVVKASSYRRLTRLKRLPKGVEATARKVTNE